MHQKLLAIFFMLLLASALYAQTPLKDSQLFITNNTDTAINVQTTLLTNDSDFHEARDWQGENSPILPFASKKVLWFSRIKSLKKDSTYQFMIQISKSGKENIYLNVFLKPKKGFGSTITSYLKTDTNEKIILTQYGLEKLPDFFWEKTHIVYARRSLPLGGLYSQLQVVIDEPLKELPPSNENEFRILTYNTQLMPFYAGVVDHLNQPELRVKDIAKNINQYDAIILEELFDKDLRQAMYTNLSLTYPYHTNVVGNHTMKPLSGGVVIFSKWPILKEDQTIYRSCDGLDCLAAKGALYAAILKQGKIFHVVGTHLQADSKTNSKYHRHRQLFELNNFLTNLNLPANEPLLIGGDFNVDQFGDEFNTLIKILNVQTPKHSGYPFSVDGNINLMSANKYSGRIDFIFYSKKHQQPKNEFNHIYILRDFNNEKMWPRFELSDHFPVAGIFNF